MGTMIIINNKKEQKHTVTMMPAEKVKQASYIVKEAPVAVESIEVEAPVEAIVDAVLEEVSPKEEKKKKASLLDKITKKKN